MSDLQICLWTRSTPVVFLPTMSMSDPHSRLSDWPSFLLQDLPPLHFVIISTPKHASLSATVAAYPWAVPPNPSSLLSMIIRAPG